MKAIDFTKYPKILPYVQNHMDKSFFKPFEYDIMDEETFIEIVSEWVKKFEKDIDIMVANTLLIYDVCNERTGYDTLSEDWTRLKQVFSKKEKRFTKEVVRQWWVEKFEACIAHLYQARMYGDNLKCRGGASGSMITCSFSVQLLDNDLKRVKYTVVSDFKMSLEIGNSLHTEVDLYDN